MVVQEFIAHIRSSDGTFQLLADHLNEVKEIAETIGEKLNIPHVTGLAGMLHDMGKYSDEFQEYLREAYNNPHNPPKRGSVNHSTAGGKFLMEYYHRSFNKETKISPILIEAVANAIYSHHGQLIDMVDSEGNSPFMNRLTPSKKIDFQTINVRFFNEVISKQLFEQYIEQANREFLALFSLINKMKPREEVIDFLAKTSALLTKYIFSALIDADRKNSREFDEQIMEGKLDTPKLFEQFEINLQQSLEDKQKDAPPNQITKLRQQMSDNCLEKATLPTGIYTLSIPTGGGKTLASLRFALRHALTFGKERIINVIPYTTIIEQNAEVVRRGLGAGHYVLEHHSNVVVEEVNNDENETLSFHEQQKLRKLKIVKDNWDAPIVFTTLVQFLNTFYDRASRNTRRLHNLANSIIIFDEVQTVPVHCISLFNEALNFLKNVCNTTIILCTATQPALEHVENNITVDGELIDHLNDVTKAFKRTEIVPLLKKEGWNTSELSSLVKEKLNECGNVLVILNTKTVVKELYEVFSGEEFEVFHLSTAMCPDHRKVKIAELKEKLQNGEKIVCLSTQLIEAGVDVSFNCVVRSLAGLDSIAQAAGRCNRHGEEDLREVYVINHIGEKLDKLHTIKEGKKCGEKIITDLTNHPDLFDGELLSASAMNHYFQMFFQTFENEVDYPVSKWNSSIYEMLLGKNHQFKHAYPKRGDLSIFSSFKLAADYFEVIEGNTYPILVPYGGGEELIATLTGQDEIDDVSTFLRKAQQYSVNVYKYEFDTLVNNRLVREVELPFTKLYIAISNAYDSQYGLNIHGEAKMEMLMEI